MSWYTVDTSGGTPTLPLLMETKVLDQVEDPTFAPTSSYASQDQVQTRT